MRFKRRKRRSPERQYLHVLLRPRQWRAVTKSFGLRLFRRLGAASLPVRRGQASRSSGATYSPRDCRRPSRLLGFGPAPFRNHFDANILLKRLKPRLQGFLVRRRGSERMPRCPSPNVPTARRRSRAGAGFRFRGGHLAKGEAYLMAPSGPETRIRSTSFSASAPKSGASPDGAAFQPSAPCVPAKSVSNGPVIRENMLESASASAEVSSPGAW